MRVTDYILSIDQGTTSTRVLAIAPNQEILALHQIPLQQHYPNSGWVEHNASDIWNAVLSCLENVLQQMKERGTPLAIGITNQRETTVVWDHETGDPVYNAIVWQDRRTADMCDTLKSDTAFAQQVHQATGLLLDPYFSATKLVWLLDTDGGPKLRSKAEAGELCFGTIESYLTYRLTGCKTHVTDATNASRTMLCDIRAGTWSGAILNRLNIPRNLLPDIVDNIGHVGTIANGLPGSGLPITGLIGDQQSAAIGQGCLTPGSIKSTYGTGCFVLQNTGAEIVYSQNRLLSTIAFQTNGQIHYAVEGSIFNAGTVVQWLRDEMGLIKDAQETATIAASIDDTGGVYLIPAFTGIGAPYWDADARGIITGLTRNSGRAEIVRAGLESITYQTYDLLNALKLDGANQPDILRIDGGMAANDWLSQDLADICGITVERPKSVETTAIGAALCAGVGVGLWDNLSDATKTWQLDSQFSPQCGDDTRQNRLKGWNKAVQQCLS